MGANRSRDQERAAYAWKSVGVAPGKEYVDLAKGAPALIMANGLMQTLAFLNGKGKDKNHHAQLLKGVCGWLVESRVLATRTEQFTDVMEALHDSDSDTYMRATEEALEVLRWIRQFAAARKEG